VKRNSPLAPGRRKVRPRVPDAVRAEVKQRTHGLCHLCLYRLGYRLPVAGGAATEPVRQLPHRRGAKRIAHLHHVFPVERWPELAKLSANLIGLCHDCHFGHEYPGCKPTRIPRAALPPEAIALAAGNGPRLNYLERTYPLTDAGRIPA
jgi:hypothetical protein